MIAEITGKIIHRSEHALLLEVNGVVYEILIPASVLQRLDAQVDPEGRVRLKTYHYFQISPSSGVPVLVGFLSDLERDFFLQFIKVSGIGPRAAVKALSQPISEIAGAIAQGDHKFLTTLPGIGTQKAREIIAKLQNKVGMYGLIQDQAPSGTGLAVESVPDWQEEALEVLLQLQYKKPEAQNMIRKALERAPQITAAEELLNEIYKQRISKS